MANKAKLMMDKVGVVIMQQTYKDFQVFSNKNGLLKVGSIFNKMLNQLRGIGAEGKERILKRHSTFVSFFREVQQFKNLEEVETYLNGTKGGSKSKMKFNEVERLEERYGLKCLDLNRP